MTLTSKGVAVGNPITTFLFCSISCTRFSTSPVTLCSAPHPSTQLMFSFFFFFWFVAVYVHQHWPGEWNVGRMRQSDQLEPLLVISGRRRRWIEQLPSHHHTQPAASAKLCKQPAAAAATAATTAAAAERLTLEHGLLYRFGRQYGGLRYDIATGTPPSPPPSPPAATATTGRWLRFQSEPLR